MRTMLLVPALLVLVSADPSAAQQARTDSDREAGLRPRLSAPDADFSIMTRQEDVTLLLKGDSLLVQLTDEGLEDLRSGIGDDDGDGESSLLAQIIAGAVRGSLVALMDRAVAMHVSEVDRGAYEREGLRLLKEDGEELFNITVNDRDVMEDFSERDARRFLERLESAKRRAAP